MQEKNGIGPHFSGLAPQGAEPRHLVDAPHSPPHRPTAETVASQDSGHAPPPRARLFSCRGVSRGGPIPLMPGSPFSHRRAHQLEAIRVPPKAAEILPCVRDSQTAGDGSCSSRMTLIFRRRSPLQVFGQFAPRSALLSPWCIVLVSFQRPTNPLFSCGVLEAVVLD